MKNIKSIVLDRYADTTRYEYVEPGIYKTIYPDLPFDDAMTNYVTTLSFTLEAKRGELENTQYPEEDILDRFLVYVRDFVKEPNGVDDPIMIHEFESTELNDIRSLLSLVGKNVYNYTEGDYIKLKIEPENAYEDLSTSDPDSDHPIFDYWIHLFTFKGRLPRKLFWKQMLINGILIFITQLVTILLFSVFLSDQTVEKITTALITIQMITNFLPFFSALARRVRDSTRSGWFTFVFLIPYVGLFILLILLLLPTNKKHNLSE